MARIVQLTVEFHADPELTPADAQQMLDEAVDAINEVGYVSEISWLPERTED